MVVQALIDSLSRCLGAPGGLSQNDNIDGRVRGVTVTPQHHQHNTAENSVTAQDSRKRHQNGQGGGRALGLNTEFDAIFNEDNAQTGRGASPGGNYRPSSQHKQNVHDSANCTPGKNCRTPTPLRDKVVGYDNVVMKARSKISPGNVDNKKKKRKSSIQDIFRTKNFPEHRDNTRHSVKDGKGFAHTTMCGMTSPKYSGYDSSPLKDPFSSPMEFMTRMAGYGGLCFAAPIRDSEDDADVPQNVTHGNIIPSNDFTNEVDYDEETSAGPIFSQETVNSGLFNHAVETQPPMPLFDRYKVRVDDNANELMGIVSSDTHSSVHMMRMFAAEQGDEDGRSSIVEATAEQTKDLLMNDESDEDMNSRSRSSTRSRSVSGMRAKRDQEERNNSEGQQNTRGTPQGSPVKSEVHFQSRKATDASNSVFHKVVEQPVHLTASKLGRLDKMPIDYDEMPEMCNSSNSTMQSSVESSRSYSIMKPSKNSQEIRCASVPRLY